MVARYFRRRSEPGVALGLLPAARVDQAVLPRDWLDERDARILRPNGLPAWRTDPLVQLRTRQAAWPGGFSPGMSMRNGPDIDGLAMVDHQRRDDGRTTFIETILHTKSGLVVTHRLSHDAGAPFLRLNVTCRNEGSRPQTLEMLSSFSLSGITPFHHTFAPGRLRLHRFRSGWSAEGRHVIDEIEHLQLERSWTGYTTACERFGQVGSMPVRRWFPTALLEDRDAGVVWGAALAWAGSWQIEVYRRGDFIELSGGLADREFGHWFKTLAPGEQIDAPPALLSCLAGDADQLCQRLTEAQRPAVPANESSEMPLCFNEWCASWGNPTHEKLLAQAKLAAQHGVTYFVLDNGWQKGRHGVGKQCLGDWEPRTDVFPQGLAATCRQIQKLGLKPGLWIEFEVATESSGAFHECAHLMLHLDGEPIYASGRRFWDLRKPEVLERLENQVVQLVERHGVAFLKVDYNGCLPFGVDGQESPGEGLRQHILGVHRLFERLHQRLPELVIENCASGGHRLEPSMMARTTVASSSDAHLGYEIPVIAANLHRLIPPERSLIWAVLNKGDSPEQIAYTMASTFLGRVCLSGDITELNDAQWRLVDEAIALYRQAAPVIQNGLTRWHSPPQKSYRDLHGHQIVSRTCRRGDAMLAVIHRFADGPTTLDLPLDASWKQAAAFPEKLVPVRLQQQRLTVELPSPFSAAVVLLQR